MGLVRKKRGIRFNCVSRIVYRLWLRDQGREFEIGARLRLSSRDARSSIEYMRSLVNIGRCRTIGYIEVVNGLLDA